MGRRGPGKLLQTDGQRARFLVRSVSLAREAVGVSPLLPQTWTVRMGGARLERATSCL